MTVEADESYAKGVAAIKAGNMDDAIELLARALELKVTVHGEQAIECAAACYGMAARSSTRRRTRTPSSASRRRRRRIPR